jgi:hypothetical protein
LQNIYLQEADGETIAIYEILCLQTGFKYIGSSRDVHARFYNHLLTLKKGSHPCRGLQKDYDSGYDFLFSIIKSFDVITKRELLEREASEIKAASYLYEFKAPTGKGARDEVLKSRYYRKNQFYIENGYPIQYPKKTGKPPIWKLWKGNQIDDR